MVCCSKGYSCCLLVVACAECMTTCQPTWLPQYCYTTADPQSSRLDMQSSPETMYAHGNGDILNVIFYSLVWIIVHALLQEYIWEVRTACCCYRPTGSLLLILIAHCEEAPLVQDQDQ